MSEAHTRSKEAPRLETFAGSKLDRSVQYVRTILSYLDQRVFGIESLILKYLVVSIILIYLDSLFPTSLPETGVAVTR